MSGKEDLPIDQPIEVAPLEESHHAIYVAEGSGKTAQNEGAQAKSVRNVSADGSFSYFVQPLAGSRP
jgi:hypothetical protein